MSLVPWDARKSEQKVRDFSFSMSQFALDQMGKVLDGFLLTCARRAMSARIMPSWSEMPGMVCILLTRLGLLMQNRSRIASFLVGWRWSYANDAPKQVARDPCSRSDRLGCFRPHSAVVPLPLLGSNRARPHGSAGRDETIICSTDTNQLNKLLYLWIYLLNTTMGAKHNHFLVYMPRDNTASCLQVTLFAGKTLI